MKYLIVAYINSDEIIRDLENILGYYHFSIIETNSSYRAFIGHFRGGPGKLINKLNNELEEIEFSIEDSVFLTYPMLTPDGHPSLSSLVIKRKGNRFLRNKFLL